MKADANKFMVVAKAAAILDCSPTRIYELIDTGKIKAIRLGPRGIRIEVKSFWDYIQNNRIAPGDLVMPEYQQIENYSR